MQSSLASIVGGEPSIDTSTTTCVGFILEAQNGAILSSSIWRGGVGRGAPLATALFSPSRMANDGSVGVGAKVGEQRVGPGVGPGVMAAKVADRRIDGVV